MSQSFPRPKVEELFLRLYDRPLHPELFDVLACRTVARDGYTLSVRITRTGHLIGWTNGRDHLTELTATEDMDLPEAGKRIGHRFDGERRTRSAVAGGVRYQVSSQIEVLPAEHYAHFHAELASDGARKGMVFHCSGGHRLGLAPLGVVIVQVIHSGLSVGAFHTFPEERTVIKTQSLIEWA